jgi:peptidoglycan-associated lipoprotein
MPVPVTRAARDEPKGISPIGSCNAVRALCPWLSALTLSAFLSVIALPDGPAFSQSREVLLGRFGDPAVPTVPPETAPSLTPSARSLERDAHRRLQDARDDLAAGHTQAARRQFEVLVHNYSDTEAAEAARQELARIYAADRPAADGNRGRRLGSQDRSGGASAGRQEQSGPTAASRRGPTDLARAADMRNAQLSHDLRSSAGDRIFFGNGSADLGARARQVLAAQATWLGRHPDVAITLEAHADDSGSAAYNSELAGRRAEAVQQRLVEEGVAAERITIAAHGRDRKIASCPAPECAAQNRRVITSIGGPSAWPKPDQTARSGLVGPRRD